MKSVKSSPKMMAIHPMRLMKAFGAMIVVAVMICTGSMSLAYAGKGGNGNGGGNNGGGDPPPDPPPVQYHLTWLDNIWGPNWSIRAVDMNDSGSVVGRAQEQDTFETRGFVYVAGVMIDLNNLGASWSDLDDPGGSANDWVASKAGGINASGQIAGVAENQTSLNQRAFVLSFPAAAAPHFTLLPAVGSGDIYNAVINDLGDVAAGSDGDAIVYLSPGYTPSVIQGMGSSVAEINNLGEIVEQGGSYATPDGAGGYTVDQIADHWFYKINDAGQISGSRSKTNGKNGQAGGPIRRDVASGAEQLLKSGGITDFAAGINEAGDVCFTNGGRGYVYTESTDENGQPYGTLALDDLVINAEADWTGLTIQPWAINAPDSTGFGQICGQAGQFFYRSFILTPEPPPSN